MSLRINSLSKISLSNISLSEDGLTRDHAEIAIQINAVKQS